MTLQKLPDAPSVTQIFPEKRQVPLEGLYLDQRLAEISVKAGRPLVVTNFVTDRNGVIAKADQSQNFKIPLELKNDSDWRLFQELMAQSDVIISGAAYLNRLSTPGSQTQDVLYQFEPGGEFEKLGEWRLITGYKKRSPDLAIVTRSLDFKIPEDLLKSSRKIMVFTTYALANSDRAKALSASGVLVVGSGETMVTGDRMIAALSNGTGYRVILMATGPGVLKLLLDAKRLDLLYVTEVQSEIPFDDPSIVQKILPQGQRVNQLSEFSVTHQYLQENVLTDNGSHISQLFLRYDRKGVLADRQLTL